MADLGEVLGAVLAGLAHARRQADETAAQLAEYYRASPLLGGMAAARFRIPELVLDIPVVVESYEAGSAAVRESKAKIVASLMTQLTSSAGAEGVAISRDKKHRIKAAIEASLDAAEDLGMNQLASPENVASLAGHALEKELELLADADLTESQTEVLVSELKSRARTVALKQPAAPPRIVANVLTRDAQQIDPDRLTRIKLTVSEEGVEWTRVDRPDGTKADILTPE